MSVLHIPTTISTGGSIAWAGYESYNGSPPDHLRGVSTTAGTHIAYIDFNHLVDIQMASASTILVHNGAINTVAGNVTLIW